MYVILGPQKDLVKISASWSFDAREDLFFDEMTIDF